MLSQLVRGGVAVGAGGSRVATAVAAMAPVPVSEEMHRDEGDEEEGEESVLSEPVHVGLPGDG